MDRKALAHLRHHRALAEKLFKTNAYIAGGALRDLDNDKPIKDIDIFIPCPKGNKKIHTDAMQEQNRRYSYVADLERLYGTKVKLLGKNYDNWSGIRIFNVVEIPHKPYPIQLIFYNHGGRMGPLTLLGRFDINLCRIADDGERTMRTAEYRSDRDNKQITVNEESFFMTEVVDKRLRRIRDKYPDFELGEIPTPRAQVESSEWSDNAVHRLFYNLNLTDLEPTWTVTR